VIGRTLGHYRVVEPLGAGGMGEVYRAHDEKLGRDVALKVLPSGALADEDARRRFRKEAAMLSQLTHPHIASLFDADSSDGSDFLVMELVPGATLEEELRKGPLAEKEAVRLGAQLARGLMAAHERGVIHRDLKPSNLGLTADGLLKVLDFGVAQLERGARAGRDDETTTHTGPGAVVGSPPYMSPEQLLGRDVDARSDLYAAGAVLYELVTGKRPFGSKTGVELQDAVLHEAPDPPRELNGTVMPGLEAVILKALDKDKALRYQSARELLVDLERLQAGGGAAAMSSSAQKARSRRRVRSRRWAWAALLVAIVAGAGSWALWPAPPLRIGVSSDGLWAAYVTHPQGELWTSRIDGSARRQLSPAGTLAVLPRWSPDGTSVAYVAQGPGERHLGLRRVRPDGRGDELLAREPGQNVWDVCWLPDGESLVFSYLGPTIVGGAGRLGVLSLDLRTRRVSSLPGAEKLLCPKCSRRGDLIAQEGSTFFPGQWIRRYGRTDWERVDLRQIYPNWTRGGEAIIGIDFGGSHAVRFSLETRTRTVVADLPDLVTGFEVPWMGLDAQDAPLVLREQGKWDLYALDLSIERVPDVPHR
jgi:hypothetical protein